ncbi:MAG: hypothetical protein ERJ67_08600 [Aphanocapsa feldmannii 277cV]|uniref:Uncharacterized protein n=1 Tax=Aphanocapsa feldmannii 277cV TaxID=2507553 RepID=A0A524RLY7_9CHRO|nr:MAG: hypothetical protein ERJ69_08000 [Aphanocapsa feldmannii 288cV]TGG91190.1 MAG: hypothetical protein ERJ67_08600 [Aphanocapsa feldmannii 277cV]
MTLLSPPHLSTSIWRRCAQCRHFSRPRPKRCDCTLHGLQIDGEQVAQRWCDDFDAAQLSLTA